MFSCRGLGADELSQLTSSKRLGFDEIALFLGGFCELCTPIELGRREDETRGVARIVQVFCEIRLLGRCHCVDVAYQHQAHVGHHRERSGSGDHGRCLEAFAVEQLDVEAGRAHRVDRLAHGIDRAFDQQPFGADQDIDRVERAFRGPLGDIIDGWHDSAGFVIREGDFAAVLYPVSENLKAVTAHLLAAHRDHHFEPPVGFELRALEPELVHDRTLIAVVDEDRHRGCDELPLGGLDVIEENLELRVADRRVEVRNEGCPPLAILDRRIDGFTQPGRLV